MRRGLLSLSTAVLLFANPSWATSWVYSCPNQSSCPSDNDAGTIVSSVMRFDDVSLTFSWEVVFEPFMGTLPTALWMSVNDGPEPQNSTSELAILYADVATGRVSAYVYDSSLGEDSWQVPGNFIQTFPSLLIATTLLNGNLMLSVQVDVSFINSFLADPNWKGLQFNDSIGFWNAGLKDAQFVFAENGEILDFSWDHRTSYDRHDRTTMEETLPVGSVDWGLIKQLYSN